MKSSEDNYRDELDKKKKRKRKCRVEETTLWRDEGKVCSGVLACLGTHRAIRQPFPRIPCLSNAIQIHSSDRTYSQSLPEEELVKHYNHCQSLVSNIWPGLRNYPIVNGYTTFSASISTNNRNDCSRHSLPLPNVFGPLERDSRQYLIRGVE